MLLIGVPIVAGVICLPIPDRLKNAAKALSFSVTLASLTGFVVLFTKLPLYWQIGPYAIFALDGLSGFIGMAVSLFAFLITLYSFGFVERSMGRYFGLVLMTLGGSFGVLFANDMIALLVFWGFLALTLYMLINMEGTNAASAAAKKTMIIIGGTDALMIFGIGIIWAMTGTFSMDKIRLGFTSPLSYIAYFSIVAASFAKTGVISFHSWLPDVAEAGPTPVTAYLPASLDKLLGIYLLARMSLNIFIMNNVTNTILSLTGSVTIILAVVVALVQHDFKRLLGYHAVSQVGYMVLGIGTGTPIGIAGSLFHMLNNAIYKSCLFLSGGAVEKKTGTADLDRLGALARYMPLTFASFLVASLSISGIPPFNGFVSKWMIYQGIVESAGAKNPLWILYLTCAMFGSALTVASFMKLLHTIFLGRPARDFSDVKEAGFSMYLPPLILAALCIILGVFAFALPIPLLIIPAIGLFSIKYIGIWNPALATILILIGIAAGIFIYILQRPKTFRASAAFVGGEEQEGLERISGTEFYDTIKEVKGLNRIYKEEEAQVFDIYEKGTKGTFFFTRILQWLHNGVLPTYMIWCLVGMLVIFFILMR